MRDLTKGNITKVILQFAIPIFIGSLFNLAYNLADTRIIGTYLGNDALAAVGSVSTLSDLLVGFIMGVANGFGVVAARYFGSRDENQVKRCFALSLLLGVVLAVFISLFSVAGLDHILNWLQVMEEHRAQSRAYIVVILYGLIFSMVYNLLAANLRAIGDAYTPLFFLILSAVINIGLDIFCVGYLHAGVGGAAVATVFSQAFSALLCYIYACIRYSLFRFHLPEFKWDSQLVGELLPAGFSMGFMSSLVGFGTVTLQSAINSLGTNIIVAHAATRKLSTFLMMPFMVFGNTMSTFCGQNYGANRMDRIKIGIRNTIIINLIWCGITVLIAYTICPQLIVAITDTSVQEVIDTACLYQRVDTLFYFVLPFILIFRHGLQGMGDHVTPLISSGVELVGKVVFAIVLTPYLGYWAVIWSEPVMWILMVIPLIFSIRRKLRPQT